MYRSRQSPSRVYLHLTRPEYVNELAERVRSAAFNDGKGSAKDSALLGAPCVEFAPYGRIPSNKHRKDLRQGTIDEDREFIDFLESLTNPLTKTATADQENEPASTVREKVTTTPLVQYLKDKKANKGKEVSASSKTTKHGRQDSKDGKVTPSSDKKVSQKGTPMTPPDKKSAQAIKVENAARDAVKALNKQATDTQKPLAPPGPAPAAPAASAESASSAMAEKKRERGN